VAKKAGGRSVTIRRDRKVSCTEGKKKTLVIRWSNYSITGIGPINQNSEEKKTGRVGQLVIDRNCSNRTRQLRDQSIVCLLEDANPCQRPLNAGGGFFGVFPARAAEEAVERRQRQQEGGGGGRRFLGQRRRRLQRRGRSSSGLSDRVGNHREASTCAPKGRKKINQIAPFPFFFIYGTICDGFSSFLIPFFPVFFL
jgi:hypothetical protein